MERRESNPAVPDTGIDMKHVTWSAPPKLWSPIGMFVLKAE